MDTPTPNPNAEQDPNDFILQAILEAKNNPTPTRPQPRSSPSPNLLTHLGLPTPTE